MWIKFSLSQIRVYLSHMGVLHSHNNTWTIEWKRQTKNQRQARKKNEEIHQKISWAPIAVCKVVQRSTARYG